MKIILTESQISKITNLIIESDDGINMERDAPTLTKFLKNINSNDNSFIDSIISTIFGDDILNKFKSGNIKLDPKINPNNLKNPNKFDFSPLTVNSKITSGFGHRNRGNHNGVDFAVPSGSNIISPANGVVMEARDSSPNNCGGFIQIKHEKYITKYCHVKNWFVNKGEQVIKGQIIGLTGGGKNDPHRGRSTGSHLHYEVLASNGSPVNPIDIHSDLV